MPEASKNRKNLTLTIDADLLKAARRLALERDTSVNELVRNYLAEMVQQDDRHRQAAADGLMRMFANSPFRKGDAAWTRDDLYEDRLGKFNKR